MKKFTVFLFEKDNNYSYLCDDFMPKAKKQRYLGDKIINF
jgi:hypothetical protein